MAGDWIKMRTDLYRDPKVCAIADLLMNQEGELAAYVNQNCQRSMTVTRNVMRNMTVGALVSVWGVMRLRGKRVNDDLVCRAMSVWVIDDLSELPGFGSALESVGWVLADESGIVFPNFFCEYNVDPNEDAKAKNAERQRRHREKMKQESNVTQDVTVTPKSNTEKRREEKSNKPKALSGFTEFYSAYPKKVARPKAEKSWNRIAPDGALLEKILTAVQAQRQSELWTKDDGKFIPHPATWLNDQRWNDEVSMPAPQRKATW